ncbi:MAG: hypothetical protein HN981_03385 [Candidatus Pacebacteria bacterium]|jgi:hypothetical protein|nr:hypothetical protein [Candidatus Paceibacterota bacterium]MBT4651961.1 hypothetical protein [Candidatus Paceibacterota bacterium]MBT6755983.1 hypothetical protein [Candidatus Paceibacterota bacterium]MBT6921405.1 hypothetical protein [Candidatus Paceibacterota bacterium]
MKNIKNGIGWYFFGIGSVLFFLDPFNLRCFISSEWISVGGLTAIGTFATVIVALFKEDIMSLFKKSNVIIVEEMENRQLHNGKREGLTVQGHTRLLFFNEGNIIAEEVEVVVEMIIDYGGIERSDFLPVPLSWTHSGRSIRNFHPKQYGFLDLCRKDRTEDGENPKLALSAGQGVDNYEILYEGKTLLIISTSSKKGPLKRYSVSLEWKRFKDEFVRVEEIKNI